MRAAAVLAGAALCLAAAAGTAWGDGPHVVLQASGGPYEVTVFGAPAPLTAGPAVFSVLVEDRASQTAVSDASVRGWLRANSGGPAFPILFKAGRGAGLLESQVTLPSAGSYRMSLTVTPRSGPPVEVTGVLVVEANHRRGLVVLWGVGAPVLVAFFFLVNQAAKQRQTI